MSKYLLSGETKYIIEINADSPEEALQQATLLEINASDLHWEVL